MHIEKVSNNGIPYIRVVQSYYGKTATGKYTCKKKIIKTIGLLHIFDDGKDNFGERLKISFRNNNPLIDELKEFCENKPNSNSYTIKFTDFSPNAVATTKSMANMIIDKIMDDLDIGYFVRHIKSRLKINYDVLNFIKLLVAGRLLKPASKIATTRQNDDYLVPLLKKLIKL